MKLNNVYIGDALTILKTLPAESIDLIVTSPPYYALRDYGIEGQIGLEPTSEEYIQNLCNVFDEVKRVLKSSGSCWVNIGDTYAGSGKGFGDKNRDPKFDSMARSRSIKPKREGIPKSLLQIPARFSVEMTKRGWLLRNRIIWHKPNAMPAPVKDRYVVDYEDFFFFTKKGKYYFDQHLEPYTKPLNRYGGDETKDLGKGEWAKGTGQKIYRNRKQRPNPNGRVKRSVWSINTKALGEAHFAVFPDTLVETPIKDCCPPGGVTLDPFAGSGTVLIVAQQLGKKYIGIELNPQYVEIINKRLKQSLF